jgi:hypothetical protein
MEKYLTLALSKKPHGLRGFKAMTVTGKCGTSAMVNTPHVLQEYGRVWSLVTTGHPAYP